MPKVIKTCVICNSEFGVWGKRVDTAVTCGRECSGKLQATRYESERLDVECAICKAVFKIPKSHKERRVCCSRKCSAKLDSQREKSRGVDCHNWKGGVTVHSDGYLYVAVKNHPFANHGNYIFEHRIVMERLMREKVPDHEFLVEVNGMKYLSQEIEVHHRDENKRNNVPENLVACTPAAHRMIHNGDAPMEGQVWPPFDVMQKFSPSRVTCKCAVCSKDFVKKRSEIARGAGRFCSRDCYNIGR